MSDSPFRRAPRLILDTGHQVGDVITTGSTRWIIRSITGDNVRLEASNAPAGIIWTTTLDRLPAPIKEHQ